MQKLLLITKEEQNLKNYDFFNFIKKFFENKFFFHA